MKNATLSPEPDVTNLFETIDEIGSMLNAQVEEEAANRRISPSRHPSYLGNSTLCKLL